MSMFSKKNLLVLVLAVGFSLYQFSKHHQRASKSSGAYQIGSAKRLIESRLDPWVHEIVRGKNKQGEELLIVLRRDDNDRSRKIADSAHGKKATAPVVVAEIITDKRLARINQRNARDPRARAARSRLERKKRRMEKHSGRGGRNRKGGRLPWRHGGSDDFGGRGKGGGRRKRGRRGRTGDDEFYLDAPPALRMNVYDPSMNQIKFMLAQRGLIDKTSVEDLIVDDNGIVTGVKEDTSGSLVTNDKTSVARSRSSSGLKSKELSPAAKLTKEILESEEEKRKSLEARKVEEENAKKSEESRKSQEESRKTAKKQAQQKPKKIGGEDTDRPKEEIEVAADGSTLEL